MAQILKNDTKKWVIMLSYAIYCYLVIMLFQLTILAILVDIERKSNLDKYIRIAIYNIFLSTGILTILSTIKGVLWLIE